MSSMPSAVAHSDADPLETREWLDALEAVITEEGPERAHFLIERLIELGRLAGINQPYCANTEYLNTIPADRQVTAPGDYAIENRIRSYVRWNALAMVLRANKGDSNLGGHIASFASAATLYDVGFIHFWRAPTEQHGGDLIFVQGHSAPGIYARAFLLGRLSEDQLDGFRQDVDGGGLTSYPHPWLMPDFWQFPTVSMGLGPLQAIYQARFMKYMHDRGHADATGRKVWAFMGDGEMDEPESMGAIGMAGREKLDNLIFVVNCNLQRLDGPVRGNGKIIQELESDFRGAGWNVIKVVWGGYWDALLAQDKKGLLRERMMNCVDGEYQTFKSKDGAYVREHFFNTPELKAMVANWTDDDIWRLNRGGHDPHKVYAAYQSAVNHTGQPTVILAKTIKGYGMGESGEAQNITHQQKKMGTTSLKAFRDRFKLPISDDELENAALPQVRRRLARAQLHAREARRRWAATCRKRRRAVEPHAGAAAVRLRRAAQGHRRRPRDLDHHGLRAHPQHPAQGQGARPPRRAHRARRVAHLRHGGHVPPVRHLEPAGPELRAAGRRPADVLQGVEGRPDAAGRHQRGRRHVGLDRRRHRLFDARRADAALLHLLLDVRPAAHHGPVLGGGRLARPRLPRRRHRRPHHAQRRRPAARGRPFARALRHHPELHFLRSDLRLRAGGDRAGRPAPHGRPSRRTCSIT